MTDRFWRVPWRRSVADHNPPPPRHVLTPPPRLVEAVLDVLKGVARDMGWRPRGGKIANFSPYPPLDIPPGAIYFASGSNHPGEIQGFADLGLGVGTVVQECMSFKRPNVIRPCEEALYQLLHMGRLTPPIFVDSGAFSEFKGKEPLTPARWDLIFRFYDRVTARMAPRRQLSPGVWHGTEVYLVAPDKIGDQHETLRRMERYASRVRALRKKGAKILAPVQKGAMPQEEFFDRVVSVLGRDVVAALPMKEGATTITELARFLSARGPQLRGLHLLGMGPRNPRAPKAFKAVRELAPDVPLSMDSVLAKAAVGWGRDPVFEPQAFTYAQQIAGLMLEEELRDQRGLESLKVWTDQHGWTTFDETEDMGSPGDWLTPRQRRELAEDLSAALGGLSPEERGQLLDDPNLFFRSEFRDTGSAWLDLDWVYHLLFTRWQEMVEAAIEGNRAAERKRYGIHYTFAQSVAGGAPVPQDVVRAGMQLEFEFGVRPPAGIRWGDLIVSGPAVPGMQLHLFPAQRQARSRRS